MAGQHKLFFFNITFFKRYVTNRTISLIDNVIDNTDRKYRLKRPPIGNIIEY